MSRPRKVFHTRLICGRLIVGCGETGRTIVAMPGSAWAENLDERHTARAMVEFVNSLSICSDIGYDRENWHFILGGGSDGFAA